MRLISRQEWIDKIQDKREELRKIIKGVYSDACQFEETCEHYPVYIKYDKRIYLDLAAGRLFESSGLALLVCEIKSFDCTNGGNFNYSGYLTPEEEYLFGMWCDIKSIDNDWKNLMQWHPEIYKRVGRQHRLAMIAKFTPDELIDEIIEQLKNEIQEEIQEKFGEEKRLAEDPFPMPEEESQPKPRSIPEEGFMAFWGLFEKYSGAWFYYLTYNPQDVESIECFLIAYSMLDSMQQCHGPVPYKYRVLVYNWLERDNLWDQETRDSVLRDEFTYYDLSIILYCPMHEDHDRSVNAHWFDRCHLDIPLEEYSPEYDETFGPETVILDKSSNNERLLQEEVPF